MCMVRYARRGDGLFMETGLGNVKKDQRVEGDRKTKL